VTDLVEGRDIKPIHACALFPQMIRQAPVEADQQRTHPFIGEPDGFLARDQRLPGTSAASNHNSPLTPEHV
jgi:hypothetical protein